MKSFYELSTFLKISYLSPVGLTTPQMNCPRGSLIHNESLRVCYMLQSVLCQGWMRLVISSVLLGSLFLIALCGRSSFWSLHQASDFSTVSSSTMNQCAFKHSARKRPLEAC